MSENLWPDDFGVLTVQTPVGILREQAVGLGQRTANIVTGQIQSVPTDQPGRIRHVFHIYCSPLSYRIPLLYVEHGIDVYPVDIHVDGDSGELHSMPPTAEQFSARG